MLDEQDIQKISGLFQEFEERFDKKFEENNVRIDKKFDERFAANNVLIDKKFEENNRSLREEIAAEFESFAGIMNEAFSEQEAKINKKFDEFKKELDKKPSKDDLFGWGDRKIEPLELDSDRTKYIHQDEWKNLPSQPEITARLVEVGLK